MRDNATISSDQWAILAALRFFLAMLVVIGHISFLVHPYPYGIFGAGYLHPTSAVFGFFVLSGFSIAASLDHQRSGFYRRRFVRIWPLYLAAVISGIAVAHYIVGPSGFVTPTQVPWPPIATISIIASLLMLQNIVALPIFEVGVIWSLAPEWWHYMIAPVLLKIKTPVLIIWVAISYAAFLLIRPPQGHGVEMLYHGKGLLVLSWFWLTGFLYFRMRDTKMGCLAIPTGVFIGAPFLITVFTLILSSQYQLRKRISKTFVFLGDVSYPLYLFHIPVLIAVIVYGSTHASVIIGLSLIVSVASLYAIDYPCRLIFRKRAAIAPLDQAVPTAVETCSGAENVAPL
jgi:peptidoglycan/LPS O-acetylase OafA/YrhL